MCAWASRKLGRPVKWIESRSENMAVSHHGRDQVDYVRMGATRDGKITAFHANIIQDLGAYFGLLTPMIPELGAFVMTGCYAIPVVQTDITGVLTNKFFTDAIRGAGRPEMTHMLEVTIDQLAQELGMDPVEVRRKNFIQPEQFPYETPYGITYDSGNYEAALDRALEIVDMDALPRRAGRAARRPAAVLRGIGFSTYTEICGLAPSRAVGPSGFGLGIGLYESALVRVHPTGSVTVFTGASPHGQGHETGFAQIVADRLGTDPSVVEVVHGDTATGPMGLGTYGSRSLSIGGVAVAHAAEKIAAKIREIVAHNLEADVADIEVRDDKFSLRGDPESGMTLAEVAGCAYIDATKMPEGMELGLEQTLIYDPSNFVFPFGTHVCVVDIDPETGKVDVVRWVAVDDCGPAINPMLIDGQVHGGVVHGIGQAIYEQVVYDERGQLITGTFVDYALPTAADVPSFETDRTETKSPSNSLGVKGIGEAGTIAATPAIVNAVIDALRHEGISYIDMPLTPLRVWQALEEARGRGDGPRASEQGRAAARAGRGLGRLRTHDPRRRCRMIAAEFDYAVASSVDDAISLLAEGGADAKLLAGGHSLLPLMKLRFAAPSLLVDMRKLDELRGIETGDDSFRIGALTRHSELQAREDMGLVAAVATKIADQQVRNRGTIGGSLSHGDSAADLPATLLAYDGSVTRARARRRARDRGRRHVRGLPDDGGQARARCSPRCACRRSPATATATRSSTAAPRTGRWSASARS